MIVGHALANWFADPAAQAGSVAAIKAFGDGFARQPALTALDRELAEVAEGDADGVLAAARKFLDDEEGIRACVRAMVGPALCDPWFYPGLRRASSDVHHGLVLFERPRLTVLLGIVAPDALAAKRTFRAGPASVTFGGQRTIFRFLRAGGARLSFWEAPPIDGGFTAAASGRCRRVGRRRIEDGETVVLDGRRAELHHRACGLRHRLSPRLTPVGAAPLAVEYDAGSR